MKKTVVAAACLASLLFVLLFAVSNNTRTVEHYLLTIYSGHDSPTPSVGDHYYHYGDYVTCSVTSPVTESGLTWTCTGWSGTGSVPMSGNSTTASFTITQDSSITWTWQSTPKLTIYSDHDSPNPPKGEHYYISGSSVTCNVTSPSKEWLTWNCIGWNGTGSVPASGNGTSVTFTITQDSTINWNWQQASIQYTLTVESAHGSPVPSVGNHTYNQGDWVTCSIQSSVKISDDPPIYCYCQGFYGFGSVPSYGNGNSVSFIINMDSKIIWVWWLCHGPPP